MAKDIKDMNSVEYGDYLIQSQRAWKNQQYNRAMKDKDKENLKDFLIGGLKLTFDEMRYRGNQKIQEINFKQLPKLIGAVTNLSEGNVIAKERNQLLNQYGTKENVWNAKAISTTFNAPDLRNLGIVDLKSLDESLANGYIDPAKHAQVKNLYNNNVLKFKNLWENDKPFDKYTDEYVTQNVANLKFIKESKPSVGAIGAFRGEYDKFGQMIEAGYKQAFDNINATQVALNARKTLLDTGATGKDAKLKPSDIEKTLLESDIPFASIKASLANEFAAIAGTLNNPERIERDFDREVTRLYKENKTFNARAVFEKVKAPYMNDISYNLIDQVSTMYEEFTARNPNNPALVYSLIEQQTGLDFENLSNSKKATGAIFLQDAIMNGKKGTISNEMAAVLMSSTDTKAMLEEYPSVLQDASKAFLNLDTSEQDNYKNRAVSRLESLRAYVKDNELYGDKVRRRNAVEKINKLLVTTEGTAPQFAETEANDIINALAITTYEYERDSIPEMEREQLINAQALKLIDKLDIKDGQLVTGADTSIKWEPTLSFNEYKEKIVSQTPEALEYVGLTNRFDVAVEKVKSNPDNIMAKETVLTTGATIIAKVVEQNPNLNTIQKLRSSSRSMNELLNQIEMVSPTTTLGDLLTNAEPSAEVVAASITQDMMSAEPIDTQMKTLETTKVEETPESIERARQTSVRPERFGNESILRIMDLEINESNLNKVENFVEQIKNTNPSLLYSNRPARKDVIDFIYDNVSDNTLAKYNPDLDPDTTTPDSGINKFRRMKAAEQMLQDIISGLNI